MWHKLIEGAIKAIITTGASQYQKHRLNTRANETGDIIASIPCSMKKSGQIGFQNGRIVVTNTAVVTAGIGKSTQLALSTVNTTIPLSLFSYQTATREVLFGAINQDAIHFSFNGDNYTVLFPKGERGVFENAIRAARQR